MKYLIKILLLEDAPLDAELIKRELIKGDLCHELLVVRNKSKFEEALIDFKPDIILSDHSLPQFSSNEALQIAQSLEVSIPFILITSTMTDEFAVVIMKEGADDYILKDRLSRLPSAINNAIEKFRLVREQSAERVRINEELRQLNHRLQLATKSADLGIWEWDIINSTLKWDAGMYELYHLGDGKFESLSAAWLSRLHPDDKEEVVRDLLLSRDGVKKYDTEFRTFGKEDRINVIRATGVVELDRSGLPIRMVGISWDITKRKAADQEREVIIKEMSKRNADLEQFSYIMSHNLRSPVANIIGSATLLNDQHMSAEDRSFLNNAIHQSAESLDNIIIDLNHVLEIKDRNYTKEVVCFTDLVSAIKLSIIELLNLNEFTVKCNFSATDEMYTVKPYLHSIFYNLISNSLKYRRKDIPSTILIKSEQVNGKTVLLFSDNGIGFDAAKNKDDIFGLYKRFHKDLPGKGMGLFMVKSQVELLGGTVTVESRESNGTEFRIVFN